MIEMLLGGVFVVAGLMMLIGGWREVWRARREGRVASGGLYALVRHPQYARIVLALFGQIVHWPTIVTVVLFPIIVLIYVRLAYVEEGKMLEQFGEPYRDYLQRVPMFFPLSRRHPPDAHRLVAAAACRWHGGPPPHRERGRRRQPCRARDAAGGGRAPGTWRRP